MNLQQAYAILNIPETSTPEEVKKKYRALAKEYHPDRNKDADAEDKLKKINEAYKVITTGESTDPVSNLDSHGFGIRFSRQRMVANIILTATIPFVDSILGCNKELKYSRDTKCRDCNGIGEIALDNGCEKCGGKGKFVHRQGHTTFVQVCPHCGGRSPTAPCKTCSGQGTVKAEASISVKIPGGIVDGNILNLANMGHYMGSFGPLEQYSSVHLQINVIPEPGLSLEENDVVSTLELSLKEALTGCRKIVKTIKGYQDIEIKPSSRNKEEVIIPNLGVGGRGVHRVILDVKYPSDTNKFLELLNQLPDYQVN